MEQFSPPEEKASSEFPPPYSDKVRITVTECIVNVPVLAIVEKIEHVSGSQYNTYLLTIIINVDNIGKPDTFLIQFLTTGTNINGTLLIAQRLKKTNFVFRKS